MKYWETDEFKALQSDWYARLESSGFKDEESYYLKRTQFRLDDNKDPIRRKAKEEYFHVLFEIAMEAEYKSETDFLVLTWHAVGWKIKEIVEELERRGLRRCRTAVRFIIRRYEMKWGIRTYSRQQLNQK